MPNVLNFVKEKVSNEEQRPTNTQDTIPTAMEEKKAQQLEQVQAEKLNTVDPQNNGSVDPADAQNMAANIVADNQNPMGRKDAQQIYTDPESLSAEHSQRGFFEEASSSFMKGVGNHVVGGFGDIAQVIGSFVGVSDMYDGNMISRQLQEWGEEISNNSTVAIPEELKDPSFSIKTMMDPRFWSTHGAEFVPQLAEFILLSKGAGAAVKKGVQAGAKQAVKGGLLKNTVTTARNISKKGAQNIDEIYDVAGTGKGIGKLVRDTGELTKNAALATENIGAGMASNILSGMLNSAEAYNSRKEMVDANGNPLFTKDELSDIAGKTFTTNLQWMAIDMLSWGMTYGGAGKLLKNSGIYKKGMMAFDKAKILNRTSKGFVGMTAPLLRKVANAAGKGIAEGFEETYQETFESWAAMKAEEEVTGRETGYNSFWDFYKSKENEATKAISFAMGMLGGSVSGAIQSTNKKAEEMRRLYDRTENLKTIFDASNQDGQEWQKYHVRETMSDIVLNGKEDAYESFIDHLLAKGIISEDEKVGYDETFEDYKVLKEQAKKLNIRGVHALFKNHSEQRFFAEQMEAKKTELQENIEIINSEDALTPQQKERKVRQMEKEFDAEMEPLKLAMSQAAANKANLILGEPIENNVNIQFVTDEKGNTSMAVGLNNVDYDYYVNATNEEILSGNKDETKKPSFKEIAKNLLGTKAKWFFREEANKEDDTDTDEAGTDTEQAQKETAEETTEEVPEIETGVQEVETNVASEETTEEGDIPDGAPDDAAAGPETEPTEPSKKEVPKVPNIDLDSISEEDVEQMYSLQDDMANNDTSIDKIESRIKDLKEVVSNKKSTPEEVAKAKEIIPSLEQAVNTIQEQNSEKQAQIDDIASRAKKTKGKKEPEPQEGEPAPKTPNKDFQKFVNSITSDKKIAEGAKAAKDAYKRIRERMSNAIKKYQESANPFGNESREPRILGNFTRPKMPKTTFAEKNNLISSLGKMKYGPANLDKMVAINQRLAEVFPNTNKRVTAYILDDLYDTIGIDAVGYAIGASVYVQADRWDQGKTFMHEISHIYYKLGKELPETKSIVKRAMANKSLIENIESRYPDYILYEFEDGSVGTIGMQKPNDTVTKLPLEKQEKIIEEAFVATMEGKLSQKYNNYFGVKEEYKRQQDVIKFWNRIRQNNGNEDFEADNERLIKKLEGNQDISVNDMRDFMVSRFSELVEPISVDEMGFEARREDFQAATLERSADIMENIVEEQSNFEESVFGRKNDPTESIIDEILQEEITEEGNDGTMNLLEKTFQSRASKTTKILRDFTKNYNRAIRLRGMFGIKGEVPFDKRDFMYQVMELARYTPNVQTFIDTLQESPRQDIQAFNKFMDLKAVGQKNALYNSMWFVLHNYEMVNALKANVKNDNGKIRHGIEEALSDKEFTSVNNMMGAMASARGHFIDKTGHLSGEAWKQFQDNVKKVEKNIADVDDYIEMYRFIAGPNIKIMEILDYGYINVMGRNFDPVTVMRSYIQKKRHIGDNPQYKNFPDPYKFGPLLRAIQATNRSFTQDSIVKNAKDNMVPVRITKNHMVREMGIMQKFLVPSEDGIIPTKEEFIKKFSHVTGSKTYRKTVPNKFLESFYDDVVNKNIIPSPVYYTGINDLISNNANVYESSSAYEQSYQDLMMYLESANNNSQSYLGNMGTFGDSPRKFYFPSPRQTGLFDKGKFSEKGNKVIDNLYNIYRNIDDNPGSKEDFKRAIAAEIKAERDFILSNSEQFSKYTNMEQYFAKGGNTLNEKGNEMVKDYVMNTIANGLYMSEVFSPNIKYSSIAKRLKNSSSPVFAVNDQLKFEPIFFKDHITDGSEATDGGMYILEDDAKRWQNAGLGVFDLNSGFKFLNYSVEKDNPNYRGQTVLLKGYTTVLNDAEVAKNPRLKGIYDLLKKRSEKYAEYHNTEYGAEPSLNFTDGMPNSFPIAIPLSSEKTGIYKKMDSSRVPDIDTLNEGIEEAVKYYDETMYDKKGRFMGLSGYNFGPQQVMDKKTVEVTYPVQQMNAILVQAGALGHLEKSEEIQQLLSGEMEKELNKILSKLNVNDPGAYEKIVRDNMDRESMDQTQRNVIETIGIFHPRAIQIVANQLANTIKVAGNKLRVPGTYAHQKSDFGYRLPDGAEVNGSGTLKGYSKKSDGSLKKAEIVLPAHLKNSVRAREYIVPESEAGLKALTVLDNIKGPGKGTTDAEDLNALKIYADRRAKTLGVSTGEVKRDGKVIGYYVEGDTVLATRVPSNGPAFTGVFEAVDFAAGEGNQVQVPMSFTKTIGADLDGDALFIQHKGGSKNVNKAIDMISDMWLSKEMAPFITTAMNTSEEGKILKEQMKKDFPDNEKNTGLLFSPRSRRKSYEDSMVAKRNIGTVFNLHRISNILAAYNASSNEKFTINNEVFSDFMDIGTGTDSRNHKSALIANLILDNLNENAADAMNINEHTVSAFSLLVNLNVPIRDVARMMNGPLVKEYVNILDSNNSSFNGYVKRGEILEKLAKSNIKGPTGKTIKYLPKKGNQSIITDPNKKEYFSSENQTAIIDMLIKAEKVNEDIQALGKIMAGHNGIETNPYLLEKQLTSFKKIMSNGKEDQSLFVPESMANNPDIKRYLKTAEATLEHTKAIDPVYRPATTELLKKLGNMTKGGIGTDQELLTDNQIKKYTRSISQFLHSRMLNTNLTPQAHIESLINPKSPNNIHKRMSDYITGLKVDKTLENNMLLSKGMNMKLHGAKRYISLNNGFFDESLTDQEVSQMRKEFSKLPEDLKEDLFVYDLLTNKWDSPQSMLAVFDMGTNRLLQKTAESDFKTKGNSTYSKGVIDELERIIMTKDHIGPRNNFPYLDLKSSKNNLFELEIQKNPFTLKKIQNNEPFYFQANVNIKGKNEFRLFRFDGMTQEEYKAATGSTAYDRNLYWAKQARKHIKMLPDSNEQQLDIELITIKGKKKSPKINKVEPNAGMEAREDYWNYDSIEEASFDDFSSAMEFGPLDTEKKKEALYRKYLKDKAKANEIYNTNFPKDLKSLAPSKLVEMYELYAKENAYAYAILTTPITKELANRISAQQSNLTERYQDNKDVSPIKAFLMANNVPSNHPAVQGLVRNMEVMHKKFTEEKSKYMSEINKTTDELYKEKFGFSVLSNNPWNIVKRFFNTFFRDRKQLYQTLYGNIVETNEITVDGKKIQEFKLKNEQEIERLKSKNAITQAEYDFYKIFRKTTEELKPFSTENDRTRRDYIPHVSMGIFESFWNRGMLGLIQSSRPEDERVRDVKLFMKNPETEKQELWKFSDIEAHYRAMGFASGNDISKNAEYIKLRLKAKKHLKKGTNEDGSKIEMDPGSINSALSFGIMNRFTKSRSVRATEMPSMDLNHALSTYVHSTLFVNGNQNFAGFKSMGAVIDGILAINEKKGLKNINRYVKINWKDAYLKGEKQNLLGKKADKVVDLITKLNLFYMLGLKASYVLGNVAAGKYHNIKNGSPREWLLGEKRFWGTDKGLNPFEVAKRFKRSQRILKSINFLDINVYDEVSMANKSRLDNFLGDIALMPMAWSEKWIQGVQMVGMLSEEEWSKFDDQGNYKEGVERIPVQRITMLEDEVKKSQGKGYQITDQRMVQQYSLGRMFMQFSRFIPTMVEDRFAKEDIDIYGKQHIGSLRMLYKTIAEVNSMNPKDYVAYRKKLQKDNPELAKRLDSGLKGLAISGLIGAFAIQTGNEFAEDTYWDTNYYADHDRLFFKIKPSAVRTTQNLVDSIL